MLTSSTRSRAWPHFDSAARNGAPSHDCCQRQFQLTPPFIDQGVHQSLDLTIVSTRPSRVGFYAYRSLNEGETNLYLAWGEPRVLVLGLHLQRDPRVWCWAVRRTMGHQGKK